MAVPSLLLLLLLLYQGKNYGKNTLGFVEATNSVFTEYLLHQTDHRASRLALLEFDDLFIFLVAFLSSTESSNKDSDELITCSDDQQAENIQTLGPHHTMAPLLNNNRRTQGYWSVMVL